MKIFVWKYIDKLTKNYHKGGGLVIFAKDLESANKLNPKSFGIKPDFESETSCDQEMVFVFPDAGCC